MAPTSADGVNIGSASIDGTEVQEITVGADVVYTATNPIIIDNFEDNDLVEWEDNEGSLSNSPDASFEIVSSPVFDGNYAAGLLNVEDNQNLTAIARFSLNSYPVRGDKIRVPVRWNDGDWVDTRFRFAGDFNNTIKLSDSDFYKIGADSRNSEGGNAVLILQKVVGGSIDKTVEDDSFEMENYENQYLEFVVNFDTDGSGDISGKLVDGNGNTLAGPITINDTAFNFGSVAINNNQSGDGGPQTNAYYDFMRNLPSSNDRNTLKTGFEDGTFGPWTKDATGNENTFTVSQDSPISQSYSVDVDFPNNTSTGSIVADANQVQGGFARADASFQRINSVDADVFNVRIDIDDPSNPSTGVEAHLGLRDENFEIRDSSDGTTLASTNIAASNNVFEMQIYHYNGTATAKLRGDQNATLTASYSMQGGSYIQCRPNEIDGRIDNTSAEWEV